MLDKKILAIVGFVLVCMWLAFQTVTPKLLKKPLLESSLREFAVQTGGDLQFESAELQAFPSLALVLKNAEFELPSRHLKLSAPKISVGLTFPFFWKGKAVPSFLKAENGNFKIKFSEAFAKPLEIRNFSAGLKNIGYSQNMRFEVRGDIEGSSRSLVSKGNFRIARSGGLNLQNMMVNGNLQIKDLNLKPFEEYFGENRPWDIESGTAGGTLKFYKKSGETYLTFEGKSQARDFVYHSKNSSSGFQSPPVQADMLINFLWNFTTGEWVFRRNTLQLPFGQAELYGSFFSRSRTFKGMHLSLIDFSLDGVSLYYPPLAGAIPFNFGFSGPSRAEISIEGILEKLSLHTDWDMTGMLLSYARYFSKPKQIPANLVFDFQLENRESLSGNFSLIFKEAVFKGALPRLNLRTGDAEVNIISNKFNLAGWEKMLLPFENALLGGEIKLLANYQGNLLRQPQADQIKTMVNFTLDNASLVFPDSWGLKNISLSLDFAPVSFEVRKFSFETGRSLVAGSMTAFHPLKDPEIQLKLNSPSVYFPDLVGLYRKISEKFFKGGELSKRLDYVSQSVSFFLGDEDIKNLVLDLNYQSDVWTVKDLQGQVLDGDLKLKMDYQKSSSVYHLNGQLDHLALGRLGFQKGRERPLLDGNLFMTFEGQGTASDEGWQKDLAGEGIFSVTAGAFSQVDLIGGIGAIPELKPLTSYASGQTRFDDLRSSFKVEDGKVYTEKVDLIGADVSAKADGNISLSDGAFNYRLDAFLSQVLSETVLNELKIQVPAGPEKKQLGPISFLLAGDFENLQLKADPKRIADFQEDLQKKKSYKVFNSFLPEDFLLKRPSNS